MGARAWLAVLKSGATRRRPANAARHRRRCMGPASGRSIALLTAQIVHHVFVDLGALQDADIGRVHLVKTLEVGHVSVR